MKKILASILLIATLAAAAFGAQLSPYAFPFVGRWNPTENPLLLDDYGLQDIQNLRKEGKHFKGVSGHTAINTAAPSTSSTAYPVILNGFHFRKDQPVESHVIIYAADTATPTAGKLFQNTIAIPGTGDFSSVLYAPSYFNDIWRFSSAPAGNMVASNGAATLIWGGNEIEATAFITAATSLSGTSAILTNPNDYSEEVQTTRSTSDQVAWIGGGVDSYDKLLIHAGEADGTAGTDIIDSATAKTITANGNAQVDTAQAKYGTGSVLFDGGNDYLSLADSADWNMGTGAFTVDFWVRFNTLPGDGSHMTFYAQNKTSDNAAIFHIKRVGAVYSLELELENLADGVWYPISKAWATPLVNTWYHIALIRGWGGAANSWTVCVDGTSLGANTSATTYPDVAVALQIGKSIPGHDFDGWLDEIKISKGTARWQANFTPRAKEYTTGANSWFVGSKRPLQGVKFYIGDPNSIATTMTASEWNGVSWSALSITDNTAAAGVSLAQTGTVTFPTTVNSSKPRYINGLSLYWYQFAVDAGQATIYYATVDAPIQEIRNIWDGVEVGAAKCLVYGAASTSYKDFTDDVGDGANWTYANASSLTSSDAIYLGFLEPQQGLSFKMMTGHVNTSASTIAVNYWTGSAWAAVGAMSDGTDTGGKTLSKGGVVAFQGIAPGSEFKRAISDEFPLYYYQVMFSNTLSGEVTVDYVQTLGTWISEITGIPSPTPISSYKFSETFQNKLFLFNEKTGAKNKAVYSVTNAPDIFNGSDSGQLVFGDKTELIAAAVVYNVFTDSAVEQLLVTKKNETWRLSGDFSDNWTLKKISSNIGCVAPLTMVSAEVVDTGGDQRRTVAIWVSDRGPVMSAGSSIIPIYDDIKCYWDPNDSRYIPAGMQPRSVGKYDTQTRSYKLLIASGAGSAYLNTELEYSLVSKEWTKIYREDGSGANPLQSIWNVWDTNGVGYTYGGGKNGYVYRLENGNTWNGTPIASYLQTKDLILDNETPLFRKSTVKYIRTAYKKKAMGNVTITHYGDQTATTPGVGGQSGPAIITNAGSTMYNTQSTNLGAFLYHSFKFAASTSVADGMELTGFGVYFDNDNVMR